MAPHRDVSKSTSSISFQAFWALLPALSLSGRFYRLSLFPRVSISKRRLPTGLSLLRLSFQLRIELTSIQAWSTFLDAQHQLVSSSGAHAHNRCIPAPALAR